MKNVLTVSLNALRSRFAVLGLAGALVITLTWWFVVARGLWLALEWAAV